MADTRATQPAPAPQTETFTFSGTDTLVPAGSTIRFIAGADAVGTTFSFDTATTNPDGSYSVTQTVPVSELSFATFIAADDSAQNGILFSGLSGSVSESGFSFAGTLTVNGAQPPPPPPPPTGGLKTDLQTLIHDFFNGADKSQLKADLTAVKTDIKDQNFGTDNVQFTAAADSFLDSHPNILGNGNNGNGNGNPHGHS